MKNKYLIVDKLLINIIILASMLLNGCGIYSFTGASVSPEVETFSVSSFDDKVLENPNLKQFLTDKLIEKLSSSTNLSPISFDGDLKFEGVITRYSVSPVSNTSADTASESRLTIELNVKFTNEKEPDKSFENKFSGFADFSMNANFNDAEANLVEEISERLIDEIFSKSLVNW